MRETFPWLVVLLLLLPLTACEPPQDVEKEIAALVEMDSRFAEAFQSEDLEAIMATYWNSPDLVIYWPVTMEVRGYDNVREHIQQFFEENEMRSFEFVDPQHKVSQNVAVGWGKWKIAYQPPEAPEIESEGRYTVMYVKQEGEWVMAVDHASMPIPPLPTEGMEAVE